ncbi:hypothetical protein SAMN04488084_101121 [Pedobacter antarcticus]|nr:hypothetical protein SAMN04488084_101121 [Pedobacter antarcticus]
MFVLQVDISEKGCPLSTAFFILASRLSSEHCELATMRSAADIIEKESESRANSDSYTHNRFMLYCCV